MSPSERAKEPDQSIVNEPVHQPEKREENDGVHLHRHLQVERALVEISHHLVSSNEVDLKHLLQILGEATGALCMYLVNIPWLEEELSDAAQYDFNAILTVWHSQGEQAEQVWMKHGVADMGSKLQVLTVEQHSDELSDADEDKAGVAIPLLSADDRLFGYLGMEGVGHPDALHEEDRRALAVLGDLLVSFFRRSTAERALYESEERWRNLVETHPDPLLITIDDKIQYINTSGLTVLGASKPEDIVGRVIQDFVSASFYEELIALHQPRSTHSVPKLIEHEIIRLDGAERIVESVSVPTIYAGREAAQTVLRDITQRKESEERYRTFVKTISEAIWRIVWAKPIQLDVAPKVKVQHILNQGYIAECNQVMAELLGESAPESVVGLDIASREKFFSKHLIEAFVRSNYHLRNYGFSIPVENADNRHFVINAVGSVDRGYLRSIWGSCVEVTEQVEMERRMVAVLEEQQERIGRDLHDSVGQHLTGIRMLSSNLAGRYFEPEDAGYELAQKVASFAQEASQHVRDIYRGLAPPQIFQDGLVVALEELVYSIDAIPDISCHFEHDHETDIRDHETKLQFFRIAQEATNNALKHAQAATIKISLGKDKNRVVMIVQDDGQGFDNAKLDGKSLGLYSMKHRAQSVRADFFIDATLGKGTAVKCTLEAESI